MKSDLKLIMMSEMKIEMNFKNLSQFFLYKILIFYNIVYILNIRAIH